MMVRLNTLADYCVTIGVSFVYDLLLNIFAFVSNPDEDVQRVVDFYCFYFRFHFSFSLSVVVLSPESPGWLRGLLVVVGCWLEFVNFLIDVHFQSGLKTCQEIVALGISGKTISGVTF